MSKQCAFCPKTGKLSGEHLWSNWMNDLFPGRKRFTMRNEKGEIVVERFSRSLDWEARVVCEGCNNTWMSEIENNHAKPAMSDLILGTLDIPIRASRARSLALFAFKTAVIFDHMQRDREPFFHRSIRYRFRESLSIPPLTVRMWMAGFLPRGNGQVHTCYHEGQLPFSNNLKLYVTTYMVGHVAFQVVAQRQTGFTSFAPQPLHGFEDLAVPFWPTLPNNLMWPRRSILQTVKDFDAFSVRWKLIRLDTLDTTGYLACK